MTDADKTVDLAAEVKADVALIYQAAHALSIARTYVERMAAPWSLTVQEADSAVVQQASNALDEAIKKLESGNGS